MNSLVYQVKTIAAIIIISVLLGIVGINIAAEIKHYEVTATVIDKFVDSGNVYFVVELEDGTQETLSNNDSYIYMKFNSRDYVNKIEVGKTYRLELNGQRIPILSLHRNILSYEEVK